MITRVRFVLKLTGAVSVGILLLFAALGCGGSASLAEKGESPYAIVLSGSPSPSERHAAEELQKHIRLATGAELPIVTESDSRAQQPPRILVGFGQTAEKLLAMEKPVSPDSLGDEGFIIRTVPAKGGSPDIVIAGGKLRGSMYGVYTFLDRLGFRWYTNRVTRHPEGGRLSVPRIDEHTVPVFMYREPFIREAFDGDWAARNRVNSGSAALDSTRGGNVTVLGVHT
ncbi:MAG: alpha-glucuronidase family glycosyl hydrolase, partial [Candidatus Latescibacterota bacterium]